jgi:uncharacterized protein YjiK
MGWIRTAAASGVLVILLALGRSDSAPTPSPTTAALELLGTHPLSISEPSDLAIDESGRKLWTVTNNPARVYQLDRGGNVVKTLNYVGQDLEGIAYDATDRTLWVAEENRREVIHLDLNGDVLSRHLLDLTGDKNSGLEGICLDARGRIVLLNEKRPGLFIELGSDHAIATQRRLDFAQDYSGLTYDRRKGCFWIVSDQSRSLYLWSKDKGVIGTYPLSFPKAEGIALDGAANLIYIVSDSENSLYVYRNPLGSDPGSR